MPPEQRYRPAADLLAELGMHQPEDVDLRLIAAHLGLRVRRRHLRGCAARLVAHGRNGVISIAIDTMAPPASRRPDGSPRERFSIAHEIGHWVLGHVGLSGIRTVQRIDGTPPRGSLEAQANAYAADLLMPSTAIQAVIAGRPMDLRTAQMVAPRFGVSVVAAALRMIELTDEAAVLAVYARSGLSWWRASASLPHGWDPPAAAPVGSYVHEIFHDLGRGFLGEGGPYPKPATLWFPMRHAVGREIIEHTLRVRNGPASFEALCLLRLASPGTSRRA